MRTLPEGSVSACITDPPYNYEFIGHKWNAAEVERRIDRVKDSKTLVKNIPYGSGLAGGVRNARWYERVRQNILDYEQWCFEWATELLRVCKELKSDGCEFDKSLTSPLLKAAWRLKG